MPFASLGLDASILKAVADQGYTEPTPIQKAAIPAVIFYNHFVAKARGLETDMENFSNDFLNIVKRHFFK